MLVKEINLRNQHKHNRYRIMELGRKLVFPNTSCVPPLKALSSALTSLLGWRRNFLIFFPGHLYSDIPQIIQMLRSETELISVSNVPFLWWHFHLSNCLELKSDLSLVLLMPLTPISNQLLSPAFVTSLIQLFFSISLLLACFRLSLFA